MSARYVVEEQLAAGGMGIVYRVHDRSAGEARALKRLQPGVVSDPFQVAAFEREYQVLAGLDHPRIIRVFDYGVDETGPFYTMELLGGEDMKRAAPMPYRTACGYLRDVATSLALLHARRLIHRDLSPSNVRMTPDGHCKLLDFGALASFGCSQQVVGTPPVISPESLDQEPLDQRADLYALGALAYWMLCARHAYPAKRARELKAMWEQPLEPPSAHVPGIPRELDALVMSLLSRNPLGRPASAAEVIARLNFIGELEEEAGGEVQRLAESFLLSPRFVGRAAHLQMAKERTEALMEGRGAALLIESSTGMGRSRLLEEFGVRAQIAGAAVVRADAGVDRLPRGTTRALALHLLDASPRAREKASRYASALRALGRDVEARLGSSGSLPPKGSSRESPASDAAPESAAQEAPLDQWFVEVARERPLVVAIDNVDDSDDASLGLVAALAKASTEAPVLLMVTERRRRAPRDAAGLNMLRALCTHLELPGLSPAETLELVRGLFGDAPNVERFAEWLYGRTAGSPLYCIEVSRQLVARGIVRYTAGMWLLPADRFDAGLPAALEDALSMRLGLLSEPALALVECLSLQRREPTLELCRQLVQDDDQRRVLVLLDELARNDVFYVDSTGYRFSSVALREAVLAGMDDVRREANHKRLGEAFTKVPGAESPAQRLEAGWHLIKGGDDMRGAEMIARVTHSSVTVRTLVANLHLAGEPIEAALKVFKRHRRSIYERVPLLAALSQAGYYEDRTWGDLYGDEALDACEDLSGVRAARIYARFVGKTLGMGLGLLTAFVRFWFSPRSERGYPFREMLVQLFGAVTTITGTASLSLDVERATRVAEALSIFKHLPSRLTPVGVYEFCLSLREIGRDEQAAAFDAFSQLRRRFGDPRHFPALPMDARILYMTGINFARGAFAVFRADGRAALESADALDASGLKLYAMIASQLRFLYYVNRGEFAKAWPHREQVELHAAHFGSAWQVETWEPAALIPIYTNLSDIVSLTRTSDRLEKLSQKLPSMRLYSRLSRISLSLVTGQWNIVTDAAAILDRREPRSFIGWAAFVGYCARGLNELGDHAGAKALCERALQHVTDADREYVGLFLTLDLQAALADAALGHADEALARIDGLLHRFRDSDHPLALGLLHEARGRICWGMGQVEEYERSLGMVERWFRATETPALIAKWERLADLKAGPAALRRVPSPPISEPATRESSTASRSGPVRTISDAEIRTVRVGVGRSGAG